MSSSHLANFPHIEGDVLGKSAAEMNLDVPEKTSDSHASCANNARSPVQDMKAKSGSQQKKGPGHKSSVCTLLEDSVEASEQHPGTGRKKRARSTPDETDANGRKSTTDFGGQRDGSLWLVGEGDGPVQGSLLEEVLAEKKMALLRSPEVVRFLQKRQSLLQITQARNMTAVDLNDGEVEDDGQHSS
ncbi:uncharacterized protein LOC112559892 [Pomacea canaliculata]|nr:uncharacterized protein LOC112559892 [Pomacea canaliculata]